MGVWVVTSYVEPPFCGEVLRNSWQSVCGGSISTAASIWSGRRPAGFFRRSGVSPRGSGGRRGGLPGPNGTAHVAAGMGGLGYPERHTGGGRPVGPPGRRAPAPPPPAVVLF